MLKNVVKFFGMAVGIVILGVTALFLVQYFKSRNDPEHQIMQNIKELEKKYAEDSYGGDTPEETLRLFIEALKNGDTDLAAKYFILDKQEERRKNLVRTKDKGMLDNMIKELESTKLTKKTEEKAFFTLIGNDGVAEAELIITKNTLNNKWKITEL